MLQRINNHRGHRHTNIPVGYYNGQLDCNTTRDDKCSGSQEHDDLPKLKGLFRSAHEMQKSRQAHSIGAYMMGGFRGSYVIASRTGITALLSWIAKP